MFKVGDKVLITGKHTHSGKAGVVIDATDVDCWVRTTGFNACTLVFNTMLQLYPHTKPVRHSIDFSMLCDV